MRDLDRAFALARLSGIQSALVQAAREASWSEASMRGEEPRPFRLSPRGLAKILGCYHPKVIDALNDLIAMNIFVKTETGDMLINKDYRTWIDTSKNLDRPPLFNADQLEFITERKRKKTAQTGTEKGTTLVPKTVPPKRTAVPKRVPFDPYDIEGPRTPASAGAHASERDLREREIKRSLLHPLPLHGDRDDDDGGRKPSGKDAFRETLQDLSNWHHQTHPTDLSITGVHLSLLLSKAPDHPDWVKEAIEDALLRAQGSRSAYALKVLMDRVKDPQAWELERKARASRRGKGAPRRDEPVRYQILTVPPLPTED